MMRFVDIMIMAFLGGIESSHGHRNHQKIFFGHADNPFQLKY